MASKQEQPAKNRFQTKDSSKKLSTESANVHKRGFNEQISTETIQDSSKKLSTESANVHKRGFNEQISTETKQVMMQNIQTKDSFKEPPNETDNVHKWGSKEQLSTETIQFLINEGFTSMDLLHQLTPQMVKDSIQVPHLLPLAQCLLLQKAVARFPSVAHINEGVRKWGESESLTAKTLTELARQGIDSVSKLHLLTPDVIMDVLIKQGKLQLAEGLLLREALNSLPKDTKKTKVDTERSQHVHELGDKPKPNSNRALTADAQTMTDRLAEGKSLRLMLVGKSGSGISSTGNSILGRVEFQKGISSKAKTERCESKLLIRNGLTIEVIDTPGFAHPRFSDKEIAQGIFYYTSQVQSPPLTIIYVIKYRNCTEEDLFAFEALRNVFQPEDYKHVILAFTCCDQLKRNEESISLYVEEEGGVLLKLLLRCKGRYIQVNNRENITTARSDMFLSEIFKCLNETHQS